MIIKTDPEDIKNYLKDASNFEGTADIIYIPEYLTEIDEAYNRCIGKNQNVTLAGAGTGLTGGKVPLGGAVISLEKLNQVIEMNENEKSITVQPGLTLKDLESFLIEFDMFYPPNPTENNSTIGGNIATNASGARTFKYGATRNYVKELSLILGDGQNLDIKRGEVFAHQQKLKLKSNNGKDYSIDLGNIKMPSTKNASGYYIKPDMDAIDLFIGSECTLSITKKVTLLLLDKPMNILGGLIFFDDLNRLADFIIEVRDTSKTNNMFDYRVINGISARLIEYFDKKSLDLLRKDNSQIPEKAIAAIWFEQEYEKDNEDSILNEWLSIIENYSQLSDDTWIALNDNEHKKLTEFRHKLPLVVNDIIALKGLLKIGTDTAVTDDYSRDYLLFLNDIMSNSSLDYAIWGHIGNNHLHTNIFPSSDKEKALALEIYDKIIDFSLEREGTVSAEHGIGKLKKKYFYKMYPPESINVMAKIKNVFNPYNLLGNGNLFY